MSDSKAEQSKETGRTEVSFDELSLLQHDVKDHSEDILRNVGILKNA